MNGEDLIKEINAHSKKEKYIDSSIVIFSQDQTSLDDNLWVFAPEVAKNVLKKITQETSHLSDLCNIEKGTSTGLNKVFIISKEILEEKRIETDLLKKYVRNSDLDCYTIDFQDYYLIYITDCTALRTCPFLYQYLYENKTELKNRNEVKKKMYFWTRIERPRVRSLPLYGASEKIITPYRSPYNKFAYDNKQHFGGSDTYFIALKENVKINLKYILAILNSSLLNYYYHFIGKAKGNVKEYFVTPLSTIPIKILENGNENYNEIVKLVNKLLFYKEQEILLYRIFNFLKKSHAFDKVKSLKNVYDSSNSSVYGIDKTKTLFSPNYNDEGVVNKIYCRQRSNALVIEILKEGEVVRNNLIQIHISSEKNRNFFELSINSFLSTTKKKKFSKKSINECLELLPIYHKVPNFSSNLPYIISFMDDFKRMLKSEMNKNFSIIEQDYLLSLNLSEIKTKILQLIKNIDGYIYDVYNIDTTSRNIIESLITPNYFEQI